MNKYGYYTVGDRVFTNGLLAFIEVSKTKQPIKWHYHDDIMRAVKPEMLGRITLQEMYKRRAMQLRDKYDYLILQYSGGSDSHCILQTFLKNKIKIDQVVVKLPFAFMDREHTPSCIDKSAANYLSEWNYTIKPDLDFLAKYHPEIEIKLIDWLDGVTANSFNDEMFLNPHGLFFMSHILKHPEHSTNETEIKLLDQGKNVGVINGVEKPFLLAKDGKVYLTFPDKPMALISPTLTNPFGTEYFFWTPDMPLLAFEQAHCVFNWFNKNPKYQDLLYKPKWIGRHTERWEWYSELVKPIIYPDWSITRFQVNKPVVGALNDMSQYEARIETHPDIMKIKEGWRHHYQSYVNELDTQNVTAPNGQLPGVDSSYYYIGTFDS